MKVGDIVKSLVYRHEIGQVIDLLPNSAIIETGADVIVRSLHNLEVLFSIGDEVYIRDTNRSFVINDFSYSSEGNCWKAERSPNTSQGFHGYKQLWWAIHNLEKAAEYSL
jgi:hypothetical protein